VVSVVDGVGDVVADVGDDGEDVGGGVLRRQGRSALWGRGQQQSHLQQEESSKEEERRLSQRDQDDTMEDGPALATVRKQKRHTNHQPQSDD
jgi:hypothetical protein